MEIPEDILFPSELNKFYKEKLDYLLHENGMLKKNLSEQKNELSQTKSEIELLISKSTKHDAQGQFTPVGNMARAKIVEISRKLREKCCEVELFKTKCAKLEEKIKECSKSDTIEIKPDTPEKPTNELEIELKTLQAKVNALNTKLFDEKNANLKLKNDLKLANKLLQDEVGDNLENLQQNGSWRGRAQIIIDLQRKNAELREKLQSSGKDNLKQSDDAVQRKSVLEKRLDTALKENTTLKMENGEIKKKLDFIKVRHRNLEMENGVLKTKNVAFSEQVDKQRDLITELSGLTSRNSQNDDIKRKNMTIEGLHKDVKNLQVQLNEEMCKRKNFESKIEEMKKLCSCMDQKGKVDEKSLQKFEAEKIRLTELMEVFKRRVDEERDRRLSVEQLYRTEKHRAAKLEAKLAGTLLKDDKETSFYTSKISRLSDADLRWKLELAEENIKVLEARISREKREKDMDLQEFSKIIVNRQDVDII